MQLPDKDNELDDLIKEASENYDVTGANPDWKHMQGLLDKHMPVRKGPRRTMFFLLMVLFVLLGGAYLYFSTLNFKSSKQIKEHQASIIPASHPKPSEAINPTIDGATGSKAQKHQTPLIQNKEPKQKRNERTSNKGISQQKKAGNIKTKIYEAETEENNPLVKAGDTNSSPGKIEGKDTSNDLKVEPSPQNKIPRSDADKKLTEKTASPEPIIAENKMPVDTKLTASDKKKKNAEKRKHPLEFSLVYAPELTTIGFSNVDKPGSNYGLLVGYQVSKNLLIQTGIIKSRKNYIADGYEFDLNYPLPANHKLNQVDGYCMMYEIPLNIKSQISSGKKINFFYTAGISSYFMTSEFYTYDFSTNYGSYKKSVQYTSQRNYWLSVATAGLGVEKEITKTLNISAAPFIKIPFKGMGEGKLKLIGTGINFLLSYKPSFAKK